MLVIVLPAAGCGHAYNSTRGGAIERFTIHSAFLHVAQYVRFYARYCS